VSEESEEHITQEVYDELLKVTDAKTRYNRDHRVAMKSMVSLVKSGHAAFLFLRDDECREWWSKEVKAAATKVNNRKEKRRIYELKKSAWDKLSEKDRKALGLRKPIEPKG